MTSIRVRTAGGVPRGRHAGAAMSSLRGAQGRRGLLAAALCIRGTANIRHSRMAGQVALVAGGLPEPIPRELDHAQ